MALSFKAGSFAAPTTSNASWAITGVGFQPTALIFFMGGIHTADGNTVAWDQCLGFATAAGAQVLTQGYSADAQATSATSRTLSTTTCARWGLAGTTSSATLVSMDADGFTLNITIITGGADALISYIAIGGADLTNAKAGNITCATSTGVQAFTGVGFQPDLVLLMGTLQTSTGNTTNNAMALGAFTATEQWTLSMVDDNAVSTMITNRRQRTDKCYSAVTLADALSREGNFSAMGADGFSIDWTTGTGAQILGYLALKGGSYKLGAISQRTTTGVETYSGVTDFTPKGLLLAGFGTTATTSTVTGAQRSIGAASSSTSRAAIWSGSTDNAADSVCDSVLDRTVVYCQYTEGTPTETVAIDLDSFTATGFALDHEVSDGAANQILFAAFGDGEGEEPPPAGHNSLLLLGVG